jgi:hypothetical protein
MSACKAGCISTESPDFFDCSRLNLGVASLGLVVSNGFDGRCLWLFEPALDFYWKLCHPCEEDSDSFLLFFDEVSFEEWAKWRFIFGYLDYLDIHHFIKQTPNKNRSIDGNDN